MITPAQARFTTAGLYFGHKPDDKKKPHAHHEHGKCDHDHHVHDHSTCNHDHSHDHHNHEPKPKQFVSIGQRIANAFNAVITWFKEFFTGIFKDLKTLVKGPDEHAHHDHDHDHKH